MHYAKQNWAHWRLPFRADSILRTASPSSGSRLDRSHSVCRYRRHQQRPARSDRAKAKPSVGAASHHAVDARQKVFDRFGPLSDFPANVLRGEVYPCRWRQNGPSRRFRSSRWPKAGSQSGGARLDGRGQRPRFVSTLRAAGAGAGTGSGDADSRRRVSAKHRSAIWRSGLPVPERATALFGQSRSVGHDRGAGRTTRGRVRRRLLDPPNPSLPPTW